MATRFDSCSQPVPIPLAKRRVKFGNGNGSFCRQFPLTYSPPSTGGLNGFGGYPSGNAQPHTWIPVQVPMGTEPSRQWSMISTTCPPIPYDGPGHPIATVALNSSAPRSPTSTVTYFASPLMPTDHQAYSPASSLSSGCSLSPVEQDHFWNIGMNENINGTTFYCGNVQVPPSAISYKNEGIANSSTCFNGSGTVPIGTNNPSPPVASNSNVAPQFQDQGPIEGYLILPYMEDNLSALASVYQTNFAMNIMTMTANRGLEQSKPHSKLFCTFCKSNKETWQFYESHELKTKDGVVSCPVLRRYVCPICEATGDGAHTLKYCPANKGENAIKSSLKGGIGMRNSRGIKGHYKFVK